MLDNSAKVKYVDSRTFRNGQGASQVVQDNQDIELLDEGISLISKSTPASTTPDIIGTKSSDVLSNPQVIDDQYEEDDDDQTRIPRKIFEHQNTDDNAPWSVVKRPRSKLTTFAEPSIKGRRTA